MWGCIGLNIKMRRINNIERDKMMDVEEVGCGWIGGRFGLGIKINMIVKK